ncbi:MAG: GNAT family N-acetyltransferase, partial [Myxococcota bacterium]|nr:GNAT family N-acetyltransferase [Myxococcota bacterium]
MTSLRRATLADVAAIGDCMQRSARELGSAFYDERATASFAEHVAVLDLQLVTDGTYFVIEDGEPAGGASRIVACGGWSRRDKLFTGNDGAAGGGRLLDPAREPARVRAMFVAPEA